MKKLIARGTIALFFAVLLSSCGSSGHRCEAYDGYSSVDVEELEIPE